MDNVFFGVKRSHLAVNAWALGRLRDFRVTPARFDLMRMIFERNFRWVQRELRRELGVTRATISRMLIALEKLGWIKREVNPFDRRTRDCLLTYEGRHIVASVMSAMIWPKVIANVIDGALGGSAEDERRAAHWFALRLLGGFASRHVSPGFLGFA